MNKHYRKFYALPQLIVFVCLLVLLSGCNVGANQPAPAPLKIGTLPFISNSILQIAQDEGYFAAQGLAVELVPFRSSNELIPLLLKGELDAGTPALNAGFFNAVNSGGKLKVTLPLTPFTVQNCTSVAFVARQSDVVAHRYDDPAQWRGSRIALPSVGAQGLPGFILDRFLEQAGLNLADVELVTVDVATQAEALRAGQVDIVYAVEPWVTRMTATDDLAVLRPIEPLFPDLTSSMIVFGARLLDDPDLGERFATAFLQAVRQYRQGNIPRNIELMAAYTGLEPELVSQLCWSDSPADGRINAESIMEYQAWLQGQKLLDRVAPATDFLEPRFAEAANRALEGAAP